MVLCVFIWGFRSERENIRRASAYGLATLRGATAAAAVPTLIDLCGSAAKSTRKYASFVLGEMAPLTADVVDTLAFLLLNDESAYVRHCAGGALGRAGIRAFATNANLESQIGTALVRCPWLSWAPLVAPPIRRNPWNRPPAHPASAPYL